MEAFNFTLNFDQVCSLFSTIFVDYPLVVPERRGWEGVLPSSYSQSPKNSESSRPFMRNSGKSNASSQAA
jgi:hypothetical protein